MDDRELLRQFVDDGSRDALDQIVRRHIGMVWNTSLREMRDPHEAADVTQAVFIVLMQRAASLSSNVVLGGWLFKVTRFAAADARKRKSRRQRHEQEAAKMHSVDTLNSPIDHGDSLSRQALPFLNDAVASLSSTDRDAVLLKYIEGKSHGEIAQVMGISENSARQRLFRAIGKLRAYFGKRGVNVTDSAMGGVLLGMSADSVPTGLADSVSAVLHNGSAGPSAAIAKGAIKMMRWNRIKLTGAFVLPALAVLMLGVVLVKAADNKPTVSAATQPASQPVELGPKDVVLVCYRAALKGDAQAMIDCFDRLDEEQTAVIRKVANVFGATQELTSAVAEKFGPEFADKLSRDFAMSVDPKELRDGTETINAGSAVVDIGKSGPGKIPLVKVGPTWKISGEVLRTMNRQAVAQTEQMIPMIQGLAADVREGKYKTPQELQQAMAKMMQQMRGAAR